MWVENSHQDHHLAQPGSSSDAPQSQSLVSCMAMVALPCTSTFFLQGPTSPWHLWGRGPCPNSVLPGASQSMNLKIFYKWINSRGNGVTCSVRGGSLKVSNFSPRFPSVLDITDFFCLSCDFSNVFVFNTFCDYASDDKGNNSSLISPLKGQFQCAGVSL